MMCQFRRNSASDLMRAFSYSFSRPRSGRRDVSHGRSSTIANSRKDERNRKIFLLYLNNETWLGEKGNLLADQIRAARKAGIKVAMAHETDPERGGCEFDAFFGR